jgi:uncharacterized protein (TIGR02246 family)
MTSPTMHDEVAVRQLITHLTTAWNNHDGVAYSQPFCEDANYRIVWGTKVVGREAIAQGHQWLFTHHHAQSHMETTIETIRFLRPDVAYIEVSVRLHNATMLDGSPIPFEKTIAGMTVLKAEGEWAIATFNNAGILSMAAAAMKESA